MVNTTIARKTVEHQIIPEALYSSGPLLMSKFLEDPRCHIKSFYYQNGFGNIFDLFDADDFTESHAVYRHGTRSVFLIRVAMPAPESAPLCRAVYLCYNDQNGDDFYFTSELNKQGSFFLCGRDHDGTHILFGDAPATAKEEFDKVAEIYWEMISSDWLDQLKSVC